MGQTRGLQSMTPPSPTTWSWKENLAKLNSRPTTSNPSFLVNDPSFDDDPKGPIKTVSFFFESDTFGVEEFVMLAHTQLPEETFFHVVPPDKKGRNWDWDVQRTTGSTTTQSNLLTHAQSIEALRRYTHIIHTYIPTTYVHVSNIPSPASHYRSIPLAPWTNRVIRSVSPRISRWRSIAGVGGGLCFQGTNHTSRETNPPSKWKLNTGVCATCTLRFTSLGSWDFLKRTSAFKFFNNSYNRNIVVFSSTLIQKKEVPCLDKRQNSSRVFWSPLILDSWSVINIPNPCFLISSPWALLSFTSDSDISETWNVISCSSGNPSPHYWIPNIYMSLPIFEYKIKIIWKGKSHIQNKHYWDQKSTITFLYLFLTNTSCMFKWAVTSPTTDDRLTITHPADVSQHDCDSDCASHRRVIYHTDRGDGVAMLVFSTAYLPFDSGPDLFVEFLCYSRFLGHLILLLWLLCISFIEGRSVNKPIVTNVTGLLVLVWRSAKTAPKRQSPTHVSNSWVRTMWYILIHIIPQI